MPFFQRSCTQIMVLMQLGVYYKYCTVLYKDESSEQTVLKVISTSGDTDFDRLILTISLILKLLPRVVAYMHYFIDIRGPSGAEPCH